MSSNSDLQLSSETDVNDLFDSIAFSEENIVSSSFNEGFKKGQTIGELEGYHLGYHKGTELGSEIGFYKGFIEAVNSVADKETLLRHQNTLDKLTLLIKSFPEKNDDKLDLISLRDQIRSAYKKLCSILKIEPEMHESSSLSF